MCQVSLVVKHFDYTGLQVKGNNKNEGQCFSFSQLDMYTTM